MAKPLGHAMRRSGLFGGPVVLTADDITPQQHQPQVRDLGQRPTTMVVSCMTLQYRMSCPFVQDRETHLAFQHALFLYHPSAISSEKSRAGFAPSAGATLDSKPAR